MGPRGAMGMETPGQGGCKEKGQPKGWHGLGQSRHTPAGVRSEVMGSGRLHGGVGGVQVLEAQWEEGRPGISSAGNDTRLALFMD